MFRKMSQTVLYSALILAFLLGMVACQPAAAPTTAADTGSTAPDQSETGKLAVGIVLPTKDEPRWIQDETRFQEALEAAGYDVEILFSQGSSAKEKENVEALITKGIQVL
ncbi:MAG: hypothetical protein VB089_11085, partial [Anaerolineaceae bacterium]|nr:hypothetical protein [Anaerolineaceae bacterium]